MFDIADDSDDVAVEVVAAVGGASMVLAFNVDTAPARVQDEDERVEVKAEAWGHVDAEATNKAVTDRRLEGKKATILGKRSEN